MAEPESEEAEALRKKQEAQQLKEKKEIGKPKSTNVIFKY